MRQAYLHRFQTGEQGTQGIFIFGGFTAYSMEPPDAGNARDVSCIPPGGYQAVWHQSPRFGGCYLLLDVPERSCILTHRGNLGGNWQQGLATDTHGCILLGKRQGHLYPGGRKQRAVLASRTAMRHFFTAADKRPFHLQITQ